MNDKIRYFYPKVKNRITLLKNRLWEHCPADAYSLKGIGKTPSKKAFVERLSQMLGTDVAKALSTVQPNEKNTILQYADNALKHKFRYLGVDIQFHGAIEWNVDFRTKFHWPEHLYYLNQRMSTQKSCDIKFPWELGRCHQFLWLGEAYLITKDEKYAKEVADELNDWIDKNPLMYTVNWTCAMEVAIRAVNWMYGLLFIKDSQYLTDALVAKVYKSLYQHGFYINNNLERTIPYSNNHYYSDIIGLLYIGKLFCDTRRGRRWFKSALKEYYKETLTQILPSGVDYEKSVSYHRLMTELAVYPYYMLERVGVKVSEAVRLRFVHMIQYVKLNAMPNGKAPMIADNDDGRFLPFVPRDFREHQYLTDAESLDNKIVAADTDLLSMPSAINESRLIQDSKIAILRRGDSYLFVNNADRWRYDKDKSGYIGTHIHNDLLSFIYAVGESEIMVDPGGYVYTSDIERHKEFRSTAKHNTIMVDGEEQHLRNRDAAFAMEYNSTSRPLTLDQTDEYDDCSGEYTTTKGKLTHIRTCRLNDKSLQIMDKLTKAGIGHKASMYFHLAPGIEPQLKEDCVTFETGDRQFSMQFSSEQEFHISIKDDTISPSYGVLQDSKTLVVEFSFDETAELKTIINQV